MRSVLFAVVLLGLLVGQSQGQAGPVDLRLKLARGDVLYYTVSATNRFDPDGRTERFDHREVVRVMDVEADGTALVEVSREDFRNPDGSRVGLTDYHEPDTFKVRTDGTIVERLSGRRLVELFWVGRTGAAALSEVDYGRPFKPPADLAAYLLVVGARSENAHRTAPAWKRHLQGFPIPLPQRPLSPGETWSRPVSAVVHGVMVDATATGTLERIEAGSDGRIARLRIRIEGRGRGRPFSNLPAGFGVDRSATFRQVIEVAWSIERGRMVQGSEEELRDSQSTFVLPGQSGQGRATSTETNRRQALAPESLAVAPATANVLVLPGRGIGSATLDLPVEQLAERLGVAEPTAQGEYRTSSIRWPNGLIGYVDPSNQSQVLGLESSDDNARTDRGIGFGSSEGAVLMTHGMAPVRLSMVIPNHGGVRVLIYNDQGIAFAITSDAQHASSSGRHAPLHTVDWITVFAPGTAAKIFPVP